MSSPVRELVQTIVALRELAQRDEAQELARTQFGLTEKVTQEQAVQHMQNILQNTKDPSALLPYVGEFAKRTGFAPEALTTIIRGAAPSVATTAGAKVAAGAGAVSDENVAATQLAGALPGALESSDLMKTIFGGAHEFLGKMPDEERTAFLQGVLQKTGTGQDVGEAAMSQAVAHLSPADRERAAAIGKGLIPSGAQEDQIKLGWAQLRLEDRKVTAESAARDLQLRIMQSEAQSKLDPDKFKVVNQILHDRDQFLQSIEKNITPTDEGKIVNSQTLNAYNEQLRRLAPDVFGKGGTSPLEDMTTGETPVATGSGFLFRGKKIP